MPEFLINTLTHPAFTAIVGFLAGHYLAIGRDRRKEFNDAAATFRNNIRTELEGIYQAKSPWGGKSLPIIKEKTIIIRRCVNAFSDFLDGSSKRDFSAATEAYCEYCNSITYEMCEQSELFPVSCPMSQEIRDARLNFDKHVDNLLYFAKGK